eukprot:1156257-Pelagomonas_calceolata.AAC.6
MDRTYRGSMPIKQLQLHSQKSSKAVRLEQMDNPHRESMPIEQLQSHSQKSSEAARLEHG